MNYIKKVKIENFQSHISSELEFADGLNVIVGPSDNGKSAIIRAIKWVLFNEPSGFEFKRHGAKNVRVTLEMNNGYSIVRERTPSKNRYLLIDPEGVATEYGNFSNDVPLEVKKAHNIYKVLIDNSNKVSLNIGDQLESAFLLSSSNGTKAKAIGRLTGVHIIDDAIKETNADIKRDNSFINDTKQEMESIDVELESYADLPELKKKIDERKKLIEEAEKIIDKYNKLKQLQKQVEEIQVQIQSCKETIDKYKNIEELQLQLATVSGDIIKLDSLNSKKKTLSELDCQIKDLNSVLEKSKDLGKYSEQIAEIERAQKKLEQIQKINKLWTENSESMQIGNGYLADRIKEIATITAKYKNALKELGKCPVCLSNIDEHKIDEILGQHIH